MAGDDALNDRWQEALPRVCFLPGAWKLSDRGLIYVLPTGDWVDEYVWHGA